MRKTSVINLWAGPGVGKSRTAAALFSLMKFRGHKVELVTERAKFLTYEGNITALKDQFLLMCQQEYSQRIVAPSVDYIITDSPPSMGLAHAATGDIETLAHMGRHFRSRYGNIDVLLKHDPSRGYDTYGRNETAVEAFEKHQKVKYFWRIATCEQSCVDHMEVVADDQAAVKIYNSMVMQADDQE